MLVFWAERLVLLAVPKTGTTALEAALAGRAALVLRDPPALKHATPQRYRRFVEPLLATATPDHFETVAVLRHPVDWLSSWYRYRRRDDLSGHPNSTRDVSFDEFAREWCLARPRAFAAVGAQARYARRDDGTRAVDHLFRYEEPERLLDFLASRLGGPIDLPRRNVSPVLDVALAPGTLALLHSERPDEFAAWDSAGG